MRLNNYSYNYRFPKLKLKKLLTIIEHGVHISISGAHAVSRTCDNEVGVVISIRDPYTCTSPFTSP